MQSVSLTAGKASVRRGEGGSDVSQGDNWIGKYCPLAEHHWLDQLEGVLDENKNQTACSSDESPDPGRAQRADTCQNHGQCSGH